MEPTETFGRKPTERAFATSRGAVVLSAANGIALVIGFVSYILLARWLAPERYGLLTVTFSFLTWLELLIGGPVTVVFAKVVGSNRTLLPLAWRWATRAHLPYCAVVTLLFLLSAKGIAAWLRDERLFPLLLIAGLSVPFLGMFAAVRETLLGLQAYERQAIALVTQTATRAVGMVALVAITGSVAGALWGNFFATGATMLIAITLLRPFLVATKSSLGVMDEEGMLRNLLRTFVLPSLVVGVLFQLSITVDLWLVKRLATDPQAAGLYGAARNLAMAPMTVSYALGTALFPSLCQALAQGDERRALALVREAVRVFLLAFAPVVALFGATAQSLVRLLLGAAFEPSAAALPLLTAGFLLLSLMGILLGVHSADNRPVRNVPIMGAVSLSVCLLCWWLVPQQGFFGAAVAVATGSALGVGWATLSVWRRLGNPVPIGTLARVAFASSLLFLMASLWVATGALLVVQYMVLGGFYGLLLIALGELKRSDWQVLQVVVRREA